MEIILAILTIILAGFFAGTETVFLSPSKIKIGILLSKRASRINSDFKFIKAPEPYFITSLVGTNLSRVIFSSLVVLVLRESLNEFLIVLFSSSLLLIFSDIIPKAMSRELANHIIRPMAKILNVFKYLFYPINTLVMVISNFVLTRFHIADEQKILDILTRIDLEKSNYESGKFGAIKSGQSNIITRIFELMDTRVKETMVPRTDIIAVAKETLIPQLIEKFNESGFSRIPVYDGDIDNIISVVYAKDLFPRPDQLNEIAEEILYVPEMKSAFELLREFCQKKMSLAVVLDEYGGTAGLVTLEDLIEALLGEIYDELAIDHEYMYLYVNENTIKIIARAEIAEINEKFNLNIPPGDYTTLAGFIIEKLGHIPRANEFIELEHCKIIVEKASRKRVILVKLILERTID